MNRLLSKTSDPSFNTVPIQFTYTPTGQRQTMIDASGTTAYAYDNLDRVLSKATPEGMLSYTYDAAGNLKTIRSSLNRWQRIFRLAQRDPTSTSFIDNEGGVGPNGEPRGGGAMPDITTGTVVIELVHTSQPTFGCNIIQDVVTSQGTYGDKPVEITNNVNAGTHDYGPGITNGETKCDARGNAFIDDSAEKAEAGLTYYDFKAYDYVVEAPSVETHWGYHWGQVGGSWQKPSQSLPTYWKD